MARGALVCRLVDLRVVVGVGRAVEEAEELYWRFIVAAAVFPFIGLLFLRDRPELWLQMLGAAVATAVVFTVLR